MLCCHPPWCESGTSPLLPGILSGTGSLVGKLRKFSKGSVSTHWDKVFGVLQPHAILPSMLIRRKYLWNISITAPVTRAFLPVQATPRNCSILSLWPCTKKLSHSWYVALQICRYDRNTYFYSLKSSINSHFSFYYARISNLSVFWECEQWTKQGYDAYIECVLWTYNVIAYTGKTCACILYNFKTWLWDMRWGSARFSWMQTKAPHSL